jgi:hypothetical protein
VAGAGQSHGRVADNEIIETSEVDTIMRPYWSVEGLSFSTAAHQLTIKLGHSGVAHAAITIYHW